MGMTLTLAAVVVLLVFQPDPDLPRALEAEALDEAAAIWAPYGATISAADPCVTPLDGAATLTVAIAGEAATLGTAPWAGTFGAIRFTDGVPAPEIDVSYEAIARLIQSVSLHDRRESEWPRAVRRLVLGRVIGRVLAHEIGHYLLRSRGHAAAGLMRGQQTITNLVDADRRRFALSAAEQARWRLLSDTSAPGGWIEHPR